MVMASFCERTSWVIDEWLFSCRSSLSETLSGIECIKDHVRNHSFSSSMINIVREEAMLRMQHYHLFAEKQIINIRFSLGQKSCLNRQETAGIRLRVDLMHACSYR